MQTRGQVGVGERKKRSAIIGQNTANIGLRNAYHTTTWFRSQAIQTSTHQVNNYFSTEITRTHQSDAVDNTIGRRSLCWRWRNSFGLGREEWWLFLGWGQQYKIAWDTLLSWSQIQTAWYSCSEIHDAAAPKNTRITVFGDFAYNNLQSRKLRPGKIDASRTWLCDSLRIFDFKLHTNQFKPWVGLDESRQDVAWHFFFKRCLQLVEHADVNFACRHGKYINTNTNSQQAALNSQQQRRYSEKAIAVNCDRRGFEDRNTNTNTTQFAKLHLQNKTYQKFRQIHDTCVDSPETTCFTKFCLEVASKFTSSSQDGPMNCSKEKEHLKSY